MSTPVAIAGQARVQTTDFVSGAAGVAYGSMQALAPGGFLAPSPAPTNRPFEFFRGAGQVAVGVAELLAGATGAAAGVGTSSTGVGALVGVPLTVASAILVANSWVSIGAGVATLAQAMSMSSAGPRNLHHSDPKFLGGAKKQPLTDLSKAEHDALHKDLNDFLRNEVDEFGNHMRAQPKNSGQVIQQNFTREERLDALRRFYSGPGAKYEAAATDFFMQHPELAPK